MKTNRLILLAGIALAAPAAASGAGTASALFLRQETTARITAMGGAASALDGDEGAAYFNPSALARLRGARLSLGTWKGVDEKSRANFISGIYDAGRPGVFSATYLSYGSGSEDIYDIDGNLSNVTLSQEYALGVGWGREVLEKGAVGAQLKYVSSTLAEDFTGKTATVDLGARYLLYRDRVTVGAGVQNLTGSLKYISSSDPLPRVLYGGASMRFPVGAKGNFLVAADLQKPRDQPKVDTHLGAEYSLDIIALRVGTSHVPGQYSFTAGAGIKLKWFSFDYGFQSAGKLDQPVNKFTLSLLFDGGAARGETGTAAAPAHMTAQPAAQPVTGQALPL
jgi:hypothetical protein